MFNRLRYPDLWFAICVFCLVTLGLFASPARALYAQAPDDGFMPPKVAESVDDATFLWQSESAPFVIKPDANVAAPADVDKDEQSEYTVFLPSMENGETVQASSTNAFWRLVHLQTFEGIFPSTGWTVIDYNGSTVGGNRLWDDTSGGYNSNWAAHPNDSNVYANHTDTWMRYGPFSLVGAQDARLSFAYWLSSEAAYDFFSWEVACQGAANFTLGATRSGQYNRWITAGIPLTICAGRPTVYVKFGFKSDFSGTGSGVWVDNVRIEKYQ